MRGGIGLLLVAAMLGATPVAQAELRPHRAEYSLRLGIAANATRIGTAVLDSTLACDGWRLRRGALADVALTPSLKVKVSSRLDAEEDRAGNLLRYRGVVDQNGAERTTSGVVRREVGDPRDEVRATVESPDGSDELILPPSTLMPLAAIDTLVERLAAGASQFSLVMFVPEGAGEAFRLDGKLLEPEALQSTPPSEKQVRVLAARSWPVSLAVTRAGGAEQKPLVTIRARIFDTGVLDRLAIDAGIVTVTAYLQSVQMHDTPRCAQ